MEQPSIVLISDKDKEALIQIRNAIHMQELILASLKQSFVQVLEQKYAVNLNNESWTLDLERGLVLRDNDTTTD